MSAVTGLVLVAVGLVAVVPALRLVDLGRRARRRLLGGGGRPARVVRLGRSGARLFAAAWWPGRDDDVVRRELPGALERLARALRGGGSLADSLRDAAAGVSAPARDDLLVAAHQLDAGIARAEVLDGWAGRRRLGEVTLAVAALGLGSDIGGSRARAVDRVAAGLRARDAVRRETTALSTQARLSAVVIASCPFVFAGLGLLGDRSIGHFLVGSPLGLVCLFGGIALDGAAFWWMRRIVAAVST